MTDARLDDLDRLANALPPAPLVNLGTVKKCEIGGFVCVGRDRPSPIPDAYFAYPQDAELFMAIPELVAEVRRLSGSRQKHLQP